LFRGNDNRGGNPLAMIAAVFIAPFAAMLVQLAISRTREYGADRAAAEICRDPRALASALAKLAAGAARVPNPVIDRNPAAASLYIVPSGRGGRDSLFSTHPDTGNRIAELEAMAAAMGGTASAVAASAGRIAPAFAGAAAASAAASASASVPRTRKSRRSALDPLDRR
jgi:heat shock protein HtpX